MKVYKSDLLFKLLVAVYFLNTLIGYPYSNILIGILPVNELLLILILLLILDKIPNLLAKYPLLFSFLGISVLEMIRSVFSFLKYGLWAFRDVMHFVEIWWMLPTLFVLERDKNNLWKFNHTIFKYGLILLALKYLAIFLKPYSEAPKIHGFQQEIPLLTATSSLGFLAFFVFAWLLVKENNSRVRIMAILMFAVYVILVQSRNVYLTILFLALFYLLFINLSIRNVLRYVKFSVVIFLLLFVISKMTFLDPYVRFGVKSLSPYNLILHLYTVTGTAPNEEFAGAAGGVIQRLAWWYNVYLKVTSSIYSLLFGLGFGMPLTDFTTPTGAIVREPHNSFISTFARIGLIFFLIWLLSISKILIRSILCLRKFYRVSKRLPAFFPQLVIMFYVFFLSLSEPPFELPFEATLIYINLAILYFSVKKLCIKYK